MKIPTLTFAAAVAVFAGSQPLRAQRVLEAGSRGRDARCDQALRAIRASYQPHRQGNELAVLPGCGSEGARETARAIAATRSEQDVGALSRAWGAIDRWRDADVMRAALTVAQDNGASTRARVFATMHLIQLLHPGQVFTYQGIVKDGTYRKKGGNVIYTPGCARAYGGGHSDAFATPLPRDYVTQIQPVLDRMSEDASLPKELRNAAWCGRSAPREELR
jgi:hypothetical protein